MKKVFTIISTFIVVSCLATGIAVADVRSDLIGMKNIDSVWALDDYHTIVWAKNKVQDNAFANEFLALCKKYGQLETNCLEADAITGKATKKWAPIEIKKRRTLLGASHNGYLQPGTGKKMVLFSWDNTVLYRIKDVFEMEYKLIERTKYQLNIHGFMLRHATPQKFDYKIKDVDKTAMVSIPPEGALFNSEPFSQMGAWGDTYQYLVALSRATGGQHTWVVSENGRFKEADAFAAYEYINAESTQAVPRTWFFISRGIKPFTVKRTINANTDETMIYHRVAQDLAYVSIANGATVSQSTTQVQAAISLTSGIEPKLALAASMTKANTTMRPNPNDFYEVLYHGESADGDGVTIKQYFAPEGTDKKQLIGASDYRVRNGKVYKVETDMIFNSIVPDEVESLITGVARDSQARGSATAMYQDYIVVGTPLRDVNKCKVEIKIFKGNSFLTSREVDGCSI